MKRIYLIFVFIAISLTVNASISGAEGVYTKRHISSPKGLSTSDALYHTVKKGETLSRIARRYSVTVRELKARNRIKSAKRLRIGTRLVLRLMNPEETAAIASLSLKIKEDIKTLSESPEVNSMGINERLLLFARILLNVPYRFGGSSFVGIDCSGYVQKVFGLINIALPRTAREQFKMGEPVSKEDMSIGDVVFFRTYAPFPSHVGIYLGDNLFIHASSKDRKVTVDSLGTPFYLKRFIGARRLLFVEEDKPVSILIGG